MEKLEKNIWPSEAGVYMIYSRNNGRMYIGSSVNLRSRRNNHCKYLRNGVHPSKYLQNHCNIHGLSIVMFYIVEFCTKENLLEREQFWIDLMKPEFNTCKIAGSRLGVKDTESTRKLKSISGKNKDQSVKDVQIAALLFAHKSKRLKNKWKKSVSMPVIQCDLLGNKIKKYASQSLASIKTGICQGDISRCIHGKLKRTGVFIWKN